MRRRKKADRKATKRLKAPKRRNAQKAHDAAVRPLHAKKTEIARLNRELKEAREQQTATADVLKVISSSPGTLEPVFSTMLAKATELCEASYGGLWLREGDGYRAVTMHGGLPPVWIHQWRSGAIYRPGPDRPMARAAEAREPIQVADMRTDPSYLQGDALPVAGVEIAGIRTLLLVPMFKESEHVGLIAIYRKEVLPFTEKQIELVKISPPRPLSPSRTRGCSTNCASVQMI